MKKFEMKALQERLQKVADLLHSTKRLDNLVRANAAYEIDYAVSELIRQQQILQARSAIGNAARWPK